MNRSSETPSTKSVDNIVAQYSPTGAVCRHHVRRKHKYSVSKFVTDRRNAEPRMAVGGPKMPTNNSIHRQKFSSVNPIFCCDKFLEQWLR